MPPPLASAMIWQIPFFEAVSSEISGFQGIAGAGVPSDQCVTGTMSTLMASADA